MSKDEIVNFLVVDDDHFFRERLMQALSDRGYKVAGAASVDEARKLLKITTIKKITLDLKMGSKMDGQDGLSLLEELNSEKNCFEIVVLTGYGSIATATKAVKLGAHNYLTKPVTVDEIIAAFGDNLDDSPINVPSLLEVEWEHIQRVLEDCEGNISQAAKLLGMHRRSLQRKLQRPSGYLK